jgi:hypothetical protein
MEAIANFARLGREQTEVECAGRSGAPEARHRCSGGFPLDSPAPEGRHHQEKMPLLRSWGKCLRTICYKDAAPTALLRPEPAAGRAGAG